MHEHPMLRAGAVRILYSLIDLIHPFVVPGVRYGLSRS